MVEKCKHLQTAQNVIIDGVQRKAVAICGSDGDCPKQRLKHTISQMCWRVENHG